MQIVLIGKTNSGKSSLLNLLTNANPKISEIKFTTNEPIIGMMNLEGINMQLIENPAINSEMFDKGLINSADTLLFLINSLEEIPELKKSTEKSIANVIIVFNKTEKLTENQKRKLKAKL